MSAGRDRRPIGLKCRHERVDQGLVAHPGVAHRLHTRYGTGERLAKKGGIHPVIGSERAREACEEVAVQWPHRAADIIHQRLGQLRQGGRQVPGPRTKTVEPFGAAREAFGHVDPMVSVADQTVDLAEKLAVAHDRVDHVTNHVIAVVDRDRRADDRAYRSYTSETGARHALANRLPVTVDETARGLARDGDADRLAWRTQAFKQLVVEFHQRERNAHHFQRCEQVADQVERNVNAALLQALRDLAVENVLFHDRRGPEPRNQHGNAVTCRKREVRQDNVEHHPGHVGGADRRPYVDARFAMVTDANFHRAVLDREISLADRRDHAGRKPDADAARRVDRFLREGDDLVKRAAHGRLGRAHLPHQDLACDTPAFGLVTLWRGGHVVVGDHRAHHDAFLLGALHGHAHVHVVAGVVAVKACHASAAVGGAHCVEEAFGRGRRKNFPDGDSVHHAIADVAEESGLMARAAAGNDPHLARFRRPQALDHARVAGGADGVCVRQQPAPEHILDDEVRIVDDAVHARPPG